MYSKTHYSLHKKSHEPDPEKNEECSVCFKKFLRKHSLLVHMRIHVSNFVRTFLKGFSNVKPIPFQTGERPYKCSYCTNTYMHGTDLKRHVMTHVSNMILSIESKVKILKFSFRLESVHTNVSIVIADLLNDPV